MSKEQIPHYRNFMKANFEIFDSVETDQQKKLPIPPLTKEVEPDQMVISLPEVSVFSSESISVYDAIRHRVSVRKYSDRAMSLIELSFLLYCTQGVRAYKEGKFSLRTVPSAGARHPFETYLSVMNVEGIEKGLYRYQPFDNVLVCLYEDKNIGEKTAAAAYDQTFAGTAAVTFIWSCIPYRGEWRYDITAHKSMLLDAGHVCQNLYVACEAIHSGTCAIAAYNQQMMDELIQVDGEDEFVVYMSPVGKKS